MKSLIFLKAASLILFSVYIFLVFTSFNTHSVEFQIQEVKPIELQDKLINIYLGLGFMLAAQPLLALCLLIFSEKTNKQPAMRKAIWVYVLFSITLALAVFGCCATLPWQIPYL